jgi:aspartate carbamoyltransferase catalytic subunit
MPQSSRSLLNFAKLSSPEINSLLSLAKSLQAQPRPALLPKKSLGLMFFEPSTRTRLSFEMAAHQAGLAPVLFDLGHPSSLEKGESIEDTILNFAAMNPAMIVVRCSDEIDLEKVSQKVNCPLISGGWGVKSHPSQSLLDVLTLQNRWGELKDKKLLIVGDLKHSRVASSHFELASKLGYQIGQCGPADFLRKEANSPTFASLKEGLQWADAVMALRFQFERHDQKINLSKVDYQQHFGLNLQSIKALKTAGWILHPGPIHYGIEMETEVSQDSRFLVFEQVKAGVFMREAILRWMMGEKA